jgi:CubicO group peptidase (beta-lactamase class C family)
MNTSTILQKNYKQNPRPFQAASLQAIDKGGNVIHSESSGTLKVDGTGPPVTEDSIFWAASIAKIVTTTAVMICLEKNLFTLDDDVGEYLSSLAEPAILVGFEEDEIGNGRPIMRKAKEKLTLRRLVTQTSGFAYDVVSPLLRRWKQYQRQTPGKITGSIEDYTYPLIFEPGSSCVPA